MDDMKPKADLSNWRQHPHSLWGFTHVDALLPTARIAAATGTALPLGESLALDAVRFDDEDRRTDAAQALDDTHTDGVLVLHRGTVVAERYINQAPDTRHIVFSVSKSITATLAGVLVGARVLDPEAPVTRYVPEAAGSAYGDCAVRHLLDMTVSIRFVEDYLDPDGDVARYRVAMGWNPPGGRDDGRGLHAYLTTLPKGDGAHGERFHYVSPNSDMLGWVMERAAGTGMAEMLSRHVWREAGMMHDASITLDRFGAPRTAGGICVSLADLARFGEMVRRDGTAGGRRIVPQGWLDDIRLNGDPRAWAAGEMTGLFPHGRYRSKWYVPDPGSAVLCAIGIHGQWIYIDRAAEMVAVKQSSQPIPADEAMDRLTLRMFQALARELS